MLKSYVVHKNNYAVWHWRFENNAFIVILLSVICTTWTQWSILPNTMKSFDLRQTLYGSLFLSVRVSTPSSFPRRQNTTVQNDTNSRCPLIPDIWLALYKFTEQTRGNDDEWISSNNISSFGGVKNSKNTSPLEHFHKGRIIILSWLWI